MRLKLLFLTACLFLTFHLSFAQDLVCHIDCPNCTISCGQTLSSQAVPAIGDADFFNFTLLAPKRVNISADTETPGSYADYDIYLNTTPQEECPPGYDEVADLVGEGMESLVINLPAGTFQF
jgi:hypothetical protein